MNLHELKPTKGSRHTRKRVGRGHATGSGKTSGRGHNGQNSRSGGGTRPGFEGGQNPILKRVPKRGFTNFTRKEYVVVNLETLEQFDDNTNITPALLKEVGIVRQELHGVKILGRGTLTKKLNVTAHKFSASAKSAIEANGGTVTEVQ